jgi:hypothetical protein
VQDAAQVGEFALLIAHAGRLKRLGDRRWPAELTQPKAGDPRGDVVGVGQIAPRRVRRVTSRRKAGVSRRPARTLAPDEHQPSDGRHGAFRIRGGSGRYHAALALATRRVEDDLRGSLRLGPTRATPAGLPARRLDVLDLLTRGHRTTHIAATVFLS